VKAPRLISLARALAWFAGYGAAFMVAYSYAALPDELPLSRWSSAPKSLFFALRVPAINLLMIGVIDVLARSASRVPPAERIAAERAAATLLCTGGIKAWLVAKELLSWPAPHRWLAVAGAVTVTGGLLLATWFARPLWKAQAYRSVRWTRLELGVLAVLVALIVLMNLPLAR
jgi:hypothetical protein